MPRLKRYDILNYGHASTIDKKFDSTKYLPGTYKLYWHVHYRYMKYITNQFKKSKYTNKRNKRFFHTNEKKDKL